MQLIEKYPDGGENASPHAVNYPPNILENDVLVGIQVIDQNAANPADWPEGWKKEQAQGVRGISSAWYTKICTGYETGFFDVQGDLTGRGWHVILYHLRGVKIPLNIIFAGPSSTNNLAEHVTPYLIPAMVNDCFCLEGMCSDRRGFVGHGNSPGIVTTQFVDFSTACGIQSAYNIGPLTEYGGNTWPLEVIDGAYGWTLAIEGADIPETETPQGFAVSSVGLSARAVWDSQPDATSWTLERAPDQGGAPGTFNRVWPGLVSTEFFDVGLSLNDLFWYRLKAVGAAGESVYTVAIQVLITEPGAAGDGLFLGSDAIPINKLFFGSDAVQSIIFEGAQIWPGASGELPGTPQNLQGNFVSPDVVLTWQTPPGNVPAYEYKIARATAAGGPFQVIAEDITELTYTDTEPNAGDNYYQVFAVGVYGAGLPALVMVEATQPALTFEFIDAVVQVDRAGSIIQIPAAAQTGDLALFQISSGHNQDVETPAGTVPFDDFGSFGGGAEPNFVYGTRILQSGDLGGTLGYSEAGGDVSTHSLLIARPSGSINSINRVSAYTKNTNDPIADQDITTNAPEKARITIANFQYRRSLPGATYLTPGNLFQEEVFVALGYGAMWYNIQGPGDAPAALVMGQTDSGSVMLQGGIMFEID